MAPALILSIVAISTLATSFISGILGMAGGMILMGVLLALMPVPAAMMLHGIAQLAANGWRALMLRRSVDWRVVAGFVAGGAVATAAFAATRVVLGKGPALLTLGLTPFVAFLLPSRLHLNVERRGHSFACGLVCLALSLTAGVAGPILDIFFVRSKMSRHAVVATKAMTQCLGHLAKIAYFGGVMAIEGAQVSPGLAAALVLLAVAGTTLSRQVLERISDASFRRWTRWTVMSVGVLYLVSGIRMVV